MTIMTDIVDNGARRERLKKLTDLANKNGKTLIMIDPPSKERGPGVQHVVMAHDDWCPCSDGNHGLKHCICEPEIRVRK